MIRPTFYNAFPECPGVSQALQAGQGPSFFIVLKDSLGVAKDGKLFFISYMTNLIKMHQVRPVSGSADEGDCHQA